LAPSSRSLGCQTFLWLCHRPRQVVRSSSGFVVAFVRSLDLHLRRRHRQLGRPPQDFTSGMKASLWGACLMALPSVSGCLGAFDLRPS
jgi:hypothetical protein